MLDFCSTLPPRVLGRLVKFTRHSYFCNLQNLFTCFSASAQMRVQGKGVGGGYTLPRRCSNYVRAKGWQILVGFWCQFGRRVGPKVVPKSVKKGSLDGSLKWLEDIGSHCIRGTEGRFQALFTPLGTEDPVADNHTHSKSYKTHIQNDLKTVQNHMQIY